MRKSWNGILKISNLYIMVKSYCVKQKKQTSCVEPSGYKQAKNGRLMFFCTCAECGITKTKFVKQSGNGSARRRGRAY